MIHDPGLVDGVSHIRVPIWRPCACGGKVMFSLHVNLEFLLSVCFQNSLIICNLMNFQLLLWVEAASVTGGKEKRKGNVGSWQG